MDEEDLVDDFEKEDSEGETDKEDLDEDSEKLHTPILFMLRRLISWSSSKVS